MRAIVSTMEHLRDVTGSPEQGGAGSFATDALRRATEALAASQRIQAGLDMDRIDTARAAQRDAGQGAES
jgi:hypothetical protein